MKPITDMKRQSPFSFLISSVLAALFSFPIMAADITAGYTWVNGELVTAAKLNTFGASSVNYNYISSKSSSTTPLNTWYLPLWDGSTTLYRSTLDNAFFSSTNLIANRTFTLDTPTNTYMLQYSVANGYTKIDESDAISNAVYKLVATTNLFDTNQFSASGGFIHVTGGGPLTNATLYGGTAFTNGGTVMQNGGTVFTNDILFNINSTQSFRYYDFGATASNHSWLDSVYFLGGQDYRTFAVSLDGFDYSSSVPWLTVTRTNLVPTLINFYCPTNGGAGLPSQGAGGMLIGGPAEVQGVATFDKGAALLGTVTASTNWVYTSATNLAGNNGLTNFGTIFTNAHGLGIRPQYIKVVMVNCATDLGWVVGDEIDLHDTQNNMSPQIANFQTWCDTSNIYVLRYGTGVPQILNKSSGAAGAITTNKWTYKFYAVGWH
jgi:hypothetical protein